jgi:hypothetical protein
VFSCAVEAADMVAGDMLAGSGSGQGAAPNQCIFSTSLTAVNCQSPTNLPVTCSSAGADVRREAGGTAAHPGTRHTTA